MSMVVCSAWAPVVRRDGGLEVAAQASIDLDLVVRRDGGFDGCINVVGKQVAL